MFSVLKTVLVFLIGVSVFIIGGAVLIANESLNLRIIGGLSMFIGMSISILSGIFEAKRHKRKK